MRLQITTNPGDSQRMVQFNRDVDRLKMNVTNSAKVVAINALNNALVYNSVLAFATGKCLNNRVQSSARTTSFSFDGALGNVTIDLDGNSARSYAVYKYGKQLVMVMRISPSRD